LDGPRQKKFNLILPTGQDFLVENGKENFAVNGPTVAQSPCSVKSDFVRSRIWLQPAADFADEFMSELFRAFKVVRCGSNHRVLVWPHNVRRRFQFQ
jgi:hypothetical protein